MILADQLDAYLGVTAPMRRRPLEAGLVAQSAFVDAGPVLSRNGGSQGR
jgi:hypothetical protein